MSSLADELREVLLTLDEVLWEGRLRGGCLDRWLENFDSSADRSRARLHALYLASQFLYFGDREIRALLQVAYRDLFRYPIVAELRRTSGPSAGSEELSRQFSQSLKRSRFLPLGNPSESGSHILYYFRQENQLDKRLFVNAHQILTGLATGTPSLAFPDVDRYVFLDDFCGSGEQVRKYAGDIIRALRRAAAAVPCTVTVSYLPLVATTYGLAAVRKANLFDRVEAAMALDESYRCFGPTARQFGNAPSEIDKAYAEQVCRLVGRDLWRAHPLGRPPGQLLLGFHHNTPNCTLPVMWCETVSPRPWRPLFRRYGKSAAGGPR